MRGRTLLSQNVANADTPGYAARDLKPMDFESELQQTATSCFAGIAATDPRHIAVPVSGPAAERRRHGDANGNHVEPAIRSRSKKK